MTDAQHDLEELAHRIAVDGIAFRPVSYFAAFGVVFYRVAERGDGRAHVIDEGVFLHRHDNRWEARICPHGGPHWVRRTDNIEMLERIVYESLRTERIPPTNEWIES